METVCRMMLGVALLMVYFKPVLGVVLRQPHRNISILQSSGPCSPEELQAKDLDVVLFGATGYLGRVVSHYLTTRPDMVPWAMTSRNMRSLGALSKALKLNPQHAGGPEPTLLWANYNMKPGLLNITKRAKVIYNVAGPFERYGAENLIAASLEGCAHYLDVAGETHWRADMLEKYGQKAAERNLVITQGAGFVSLMADWLALTAARSVAGDGNGPPSDVWTVFSRMNGAPGSGSLLSAKYAWQKYGPITNPYVLSPETPDDARVDMEIDGVDKYGPHPGIGMALELYAGSRMDCPLTRRTMQEEFPGVHIRVHEAQNVSLYTSLKLYLNDRRMFSQPPPTQMEPHVGPPRWMLGAGSFAAFSWATRKSDGHTARVDIEGQGDPAFLGSSKMTSELVLALAANGPYKGKVGYRSPAEVVDTRELEWRMTAVENGTWVTITHKIEEANARRKKFPHRSYGTMKGQAFEAQR